jgi:hypothetical protein
VFGCGGGLPENDLGVGAQVRDRGSVSRVSFSASLAGGLCLPSLRRKIGLAGFAGTLGLRGVPPPDIRNSRHDLSGYAYASGDVVPGCVVCHQPEERNERGQHPTNAWAPELSNGLDLAA